MRAFRSLAPSGLRSVRPSPGRCPGLSKGCPFGAQGLHSLALALCSTTRRANRPPACSYQHLLTEIVHGASHVSGRAHRRPPTHAASNSQRAKWPTQTGLTRAAKPDAEVRVGRGDVRTDGEDAGSRAVAPEAATNQRARNSRGTGTSVPAEATEIATGNAGLARPVRAADVVTVCPVRHPLPHIAHHVERAPV